MQNCPASGTGSSAAIQGWSSEKTQITNSNSNSKNLAQEVSSKTINNNVPLAGEKIYFRGSIFDAEGGVLPSAAEGTSGSPNMIFFKKRKIYFVKPK